jgi:hypothetical protein
MSCQQCDPLDWLLAQFCSHRERYLRLMSERNRIRDEADKTVKRIGLIRQLLLLEGQPSPRTQKEGN